MDRASDSESGGPEFESCSGYLLDLFLVVPSSSTWPLMYITNWLPPASCPVVCMCFFKPYYVIIELFEWNYLSGVPVN